MPAEAAPAEAVRPRLLYLLTSLNNGGAEWGLVNLLRNGAFSGFDVQVVALVRGAGAQADALTALGRPPLVLDDASRLTIAALANSTCKLWRLLRRTRPEVLVLSLPHANLLGRWLRPGRKRPLVVSFEHNSRLAKPVYELGYRLSSGRVDWAAADCEATARTALRRRYPRPPAHVAILPLVAFTPDRLAEPRPRTSDPGGPLRLVSAGRLSPVKDQASMLGLLAGLRTRGVDARLTLYGEGPLKGALEAEAARLGLADRVELPGQTADWRRRPADLFLMTSRHEGLCLAALEAMAAGIPVAATPVGGLGDYGPDAGMLPLGEDEAQNADALATLLRDPDRLAAMSRAGRIMVAGRFGEAAVRAACTDFADRLRQAALHLALR